MAPFDPVLRSNTGSESAPIHIKLLPSNKLLQSTDHLSNLPASQ